MSLKTSFERRGLRGGKDNDNEISSMTTREGGVFEKQKRQSKGEVGTRRLGVRFDKPTPGHSRVIPLAYGAACPLSTVHATTTATAFRGLFACANRTTSIFPCKGGISKRVEIPKGYERRWKYGRTPWPGPTCKAEWFWGETLYTREGRAFIPMDHKYFWS